MTNVSDARIIAFPGAQTEESSATEPDRFEDWSPYVSAHLTSLLVDIDDLDENEYRDRLREFRSYVDDVLTRDQE